MGNWNGFDGLDLSGVEADSFVPLGEGRHTVKCEDAEIKTAPNGRDKRLVLRLSAIDGSGEITAGLNIHHTSQKAQEIALRQLKAFLLAGGHPNPDRPGDVSSLKGLTCDIFVGKGNPYTDQKTGEQKQRNEVKRFIVPGEADKEAQSGGSTSSQQGRKTTNYDDEIPF